MTEILRLVVVREGYGWVIVAAMPLLFVGGFSAALTVLWATWAWRLPLGKGRGPVIVMTILLAALTILLWITAIHLLGEAT